MTMIKVLFVLDTLRQRFGVTSVAMNYFRNIDREKVIIDFICYPDSESSIVEEIRKTGSNVYFMPKLSPTSYFRFTRFYKDFFDSNKEYSIIHSHFNQIDSIIFPIAKKYGVKVCISHSHSTSFSKSKIRAFRNKLLCLSINKNADVWAACSTKAGEFLYGKDFDKSEKSFVVYNGINCKCFKFEKEIRDETRKELNIKSDEIVLGHVGSFNPIKNHQFIIRLFSVLTQAKANSYKLLLVGDGELKKDIRRMVDKLSLSDKVIFTGVRNDVNRLFQAMDIFLLPSFNEGLPVVGIEAQASGLTCLFSETITKEVGICNSKFLDIGRMSEWLDVIEHISLQGRVDSYLKVMEKGYDIVDCARKLEQLYFSKVIGDK